MSTTERNRAAGFYVSFYWIGIIMTLACLAFVLAGNTNLVYRFEHSRFPLSWVPAIVAMLSFLAAEFCHPRESLESETVEEDSELAAEWEAVEA
jgi:hypothetical protein